MTLRFIAPVLIVLALALPAKAQDVSVVLVTDILGDRLHYPVVISEGRGYRVRCESQSDEETIIAALGFLIPSSQIVDPSEQSIVDAAPAENPLLCPSSENYPITVFAANTSQGLIHYLQFKADIGSEAAHDRIYIPGCAALVEALNLDLANATPGDPTLFFAGRIHEIACRPGSAPIETAPQTFAAWCTKGDLTPEEEATMRAILNGTPGGPGALGNAVACRQAQDFLTAVTSRNLDNSGAQSLAPLATLSHLNSLSLAGNQISDVSPLAGLTALQFLDLSNNRIENVAALATLVNLTSLNLGGNAIGDLRPISSLPLLQQLSLPGNVPDTIAPLQFLTQLTELNLARNELTSDDIGVLIGLSQLTLLDLSNNEIDDFSALANFGSEVEFKLSGNPASTGGPTDFITFCVQLRDEPTQTGATIRAMIEVTGQSTCSGAATALNSSNALTITGKTLSELGPLATLSHLTSLNLADNTITDVSALAALTQIITLDLSNNAITDVRPLAALERLTTLSMAGNPVTFGDYLSACILRNEPETLSEAHRAEIGALLTVSQAQTCKSSESRLKTMSTINLRDRGLSTLDYIRVAESATNVLLDNNPVGEVSSLRFLQRLQFLDASNTGLDDDDSLLNLRALRNLDISSNPIQELWALRNMSELQSVNFRDTQIRDIRVLDELPNLQNATMWNAPVVMNSMLTYCLVHRFQIGMLGDARRTVDAIMAVAEGAGQSSQNCRGVNDWARSVTSLNLNAKQITNVTPIAGMPELTSLLLYNNNIRDVQPMRNLRKLKTLNLGKNQLSSIPIVFSQDLENLYVTENQIVNPSAVTRYSKLKSLNLRKNRLTVTSGISGLPQLTFLDLRDNRIAQVNQVTPVLGKNPYIKGNPVCGLQNTILLLVQPCQREPQFIVNSNLFDPNLVIRRELLQPVPIIITPSNP
ncbi:leucine-rich repeat domain-containing protein [uncultured Roseovarius sp.]|uniref:leucine-rich repeat domain-containing protein n=1 Tax=uncultured Roseovarius sp. TaxID=293344 RepID=UPI000C5BCE78|nr:hypothetical protein [Roseovarius sp.]MBD12643.1 hypothetical protein [Roseovarius sp.]|tara:strand:- start:2178 stop:4976 length:2799 start_codon:yes stop_codon:yes gene_type:complete